LILKEKVRDWLRDWQSLKKIKNFKSIDIKNKK